MIYPMPSGVQLPLFMCVVVLSNVLQSYMTMNSTRGGGMGEKQDQDQEEEERKNKAEDFPEWASAKAEVWFGQRRSARVS